MNAATPEATLLIHRATLLDGHAANVRIKNGTVSEIGNFAPCTGEPTLDARGGLLLPGLHDHHAHIAATAASAASIRCGPPYIMDEAALVSAISVPGQGWLRGIHYHESVAGLLDRQWLDKVAPDRPIRVQHRSGRLWIFNTAGLAALFQAGCAPPIGLERDATTWTGRLYDGDSWLRTVLPSVIPSFAEIGSNLARLGVTGITDMTPSNDDIVATHFASERRRGAFPQRVVLAGKLDLGTHGMDAALTLGPLKLHLHEVQLPHFDGTVEAIRNAHEAGRAAALHCVTDGELAFALAALREAGALIGDRIEHASITTPAAMREIAQLGLAIVTQPHFIQERGVAYRHAIAPDEWKNLYRLRSVLAAAIPLAGGSDMPFGNADPWAAMRAAVSRRTSAGKTIGAAEALTPEQALDLFMADPLRLDQKRLVEVGAVADLCLLHKPWAAARLALSPCLVRATIIGGLIVYDAGNRDAG